jgi:catalase
MTASKTLTTASGHPIADNQNSISAVHVEQAAFSPANIVPGMGYSPVAKEA